MIEVFLEYPLGVVTSTTSLHGTYSAHYTGTVIIKPPHPGGSYPKNILTEKFYD